MTIFRMMLAAGLALICGVLVETAKVGPVANDTAPGIAAVSVPSSPPAVRTAANGW